MHVSMSDSDDRTRCAVPPVHGKEELALAVVDWVADTWEREVWEPAQLEDTAVDILVALARGHIVFCRRDIARVMMALRVEFDGREHPVGSKVADIGKDLATRFGAVISAGRRDGSIPQDRRLTTTST